MFLEILKTNPNFLKLVNYVSFVFIGSRQAENLGDRPVHGDGRDRADHHHQRHQQQRERKDHALPGQNY